jgi:DNA-binding MarR family transcriptional regulator
MGRARAKFDEWAYHDMANLGMNQKQISKELGISIPTLERNIAELTESQGVLLKYRDLQHLKLTEIQHQVLEAITPEKIAECSALELTQIFKILKDKELVVNGKPTEIKGLVGYLVELEKREMDKTINISPKIFDNAEDAECFEDGEQVPDI